MATHNDITGDALVSRLANENYRNNYDRIFGKKKGNDNAGQDHMEASDGHSVSVSVVSGAGCTGQVGGLRGAAEATEAGEES